MLKYKVKPSKESELREFPIRELYVSHDLSYVSGVTDEKIGLVNGEEIFIKSPYLIGSEQNTINTYSVKRQGEVEVSLLIPVKQITMPLNFPVHGENDGSSYILAFNKNVDVSDVAEGDYILSSVTQNYVEYNGDICYFFEGSKRGYLIDHKFYEAERTDTAITITTCFYVEDGKLQIGDYTYYADFSNSNGEPTLRISKNHTPIETGDIIGLVNGYECTFITAKFYPRNEWEQLTKFYILKANNPVISIDDAIYGGYKHYVTFNNENYYIRDVYQKDENGEEDVYLGYGILLDGDFYKAYPNYDSKLYESYNDLSYEGGSLYVGKYDEELEIHDTLISLTGGGRFVLLIGSDDGNDIVPGNFIIAKSNSPIELTLNVEDDGNGTKYVAFEGKKYIVESNLFDTVKISDSDYVITYLNDSLTSGFTTINGEKMYLSIKTQSIDGKICPIKAVLSDKIYYEKSKDSDIIKVDYGVRDLNKGYSITEHSGVTINGNKYQVLTDINEDEGVEFTYVNINESIQITFEITDINGSSTYVSYPVVDTNTIDEIYKDELQRKYSDIIVNNWESFEFRLRKDTFGNMPLTVENGLMNSMSSLTPYSISESYLLENNIDILRVQNYVSFNFPLLNKTANNLRREEVIKTDFVSYIRNEAINRIVDMEKDVYCPVWIENGEMKPIQQVRFNLHFRTRNLENWKIYEDDREFTYYTKNNVSKNIVTPNSKKSNWFITDFKHYSDILSGSDANKKLKLQNASDLLGLVGFTTNEIKSQSNKIKKSFLRLSFYSTNNPNTQVLLGTSTIFLDDNLALKKYLNSKRNADLKFVDVAADEIESENGGDYQITSNTISNYSEVLNDDYLNDGTRLSSRLVVNNKYNTDTSSEGFYLYIFKDYSMKMREATVYMKVDFNHAGIGKTMSFMFPRKVEETDVDGVGSPIYLDNNNDLNALKNGFRLDNIYKQIYIPIRLKFDDKTNKYVYYLPEELRENAKLGVDNEIMEFNLFEIKFANESIIINQPAYNESNQ